MTDKTRASAVAFYECEGGMKMTAGTVSSASIIGMIFSCAVSIVLPVALAIIAAVRLKAKILSFFIGALCFLLSAMVLESMLHRYVIAAVGSDFFADHIVLYALYGGLAAAVFEETGRFLMMKFLMKNRSSKENAVMFGIGHGGLEAMLIVGLTYVSNLMIALVINEGKMDQLLSVIDVSQRQETFDQLSVLWTTEAAEMYLPGIERISAIALQICLSVIVYRAVSEKKWIYYLYAFLIHMFVDTGVVLMVNAVSPYIVELALFVETGVIAYFTFRMYKNMPKNEVENA